MRNRKYLNLSIPPVRKRRRVHAGRLIGGTLFFIGSHFLIIEGVVHGMTAVAMLRGLGIMLAVAFVLSAFIG